MIGKVPQDGLMDLIDALGEEASGKPTGVKIGWKDTHRLLGEVWRRGQASVIAGPPGNGKSYWVMACCMFAEAAGFSWRYQPLEDSQTDWVRRMAAIVCNDWGILDHNQAKDSITKIVTEGNLLRQLSKSVCENPRKPIKNILGKPTIPDIPYGQVTDWLYEAGKEFDLLVVDPISIIDYDGEDHTDWEGQKKFVKDVAAIVTDVKAHIILVSHTTKKSSRNQPLHMDMVEGSQAFSKYIHNVLLLDKHDLKTSDVYGIAGIHTVDHRRTLMIEKTRSASGTGAQIAFDFDRGGPMFTEHGVIEE